MGIRPGPPWPRTRAPTLGENDRMDQLDDAAIKDALRDLHEWSREGDVLVRTIKRRDWLDAIGLVDAVAREAERRNHHPDVCVTGYRTVTFRLTTHSAGGITPRDLDLAKAIESIAEGSIDAPSPGTIEVVAED
jgi:4a-hydroxytetrahydrobiopterin dehydratase